MDVIDVLCLTAHRAGASDLYLRAGRVPQLRINDALHNLADAAPITVQDLESLSDRCGAERDARDYDGSYVASDGRRFRVNLYRSLETRGAVLRPIKTQVPTLDELGAPMALLTSWIQRPTGLILITGPTGSGKSTTVAACLEWLNQHRAYHIVTIEDPIEYLFESASSLFTQREVGIDTPSFAEGLRRSLRQSPDVILLGEIRDGVSALTALEAAETGHLVFATLHSSNVLDSLERLLRLFEVGEREGVQQVLAQQLVGVLCQRLAPGKEGSLALVVEHFENQAVSRKWILEGKFRELADHVGRGDNPANATFLQSLVGLVQAGRITEETALATASNPQELQRRLRGINTSSTATGA
jgi:twitching motility protein PilT